ncbi:aldolase [Stigmatella sp. ncwal1]|uniref:Aldolase n=1 Tax=Stigmatella ashevillensis TaxID=2995309 RepID=A0ABT5DMG9_9BACT|nr:aldolase [Stigmatella ashevillena]MDC0714788.1 aldolase [Stigmatella ashevillena]
MMDGVAKRLRWSRFLHKQSSRGIIVPIDHGLTLGPIPGIDDVSRIEGWIRHPGITGVIAHKGMVERLGCRGLLQGMGVMLHLNGMPSSAQAPDRKERLTSLEAAVRLGVDAVSLQINFDGTNDGHNLTLLGAVVDEAQRFGMPVLTMLYDKVPSAEDDKRITRLRHLMRVCVELGTDALKLAAPTRREEVPVLLEGFQDHTAIFFAGGAVCSDEMLLALAKDTAAFGASGLCVGRNVFQRESVGDILTRLQKVLLEDLESAPPSIGPFFHLPETARPQPPSLWSEVRFG